MKHRVSGILSGITLLIFISTPVQAQWEEAVNNQLKSFNDLLTGQGYTLVQDYKTGFLEDEELTRFPITLQGGVSYQIVGVCDDDCNDLDLTLYDPDGNPVATDIETDATPVLLFTPDETATCNIEVHMVGCTVPPCYYGVGVWAQGMDRGNVFRGELSSSDNKLSKGEYYDTYTFQAQAGQHAVVDMLSLDFDTWLGVRSPGNETTENDDLDESSTNSRVELDINESGTWTIIATSFDPGITGSYEITVELSSRPGSTGSRIESGMLAKGDQTLTSGEYMDTYLLEGRTGERIILDLRSSDFNPYLILISPDEVHFENDDFEGDPHRSLLLLDLEESGTYTVAVTTYKSGETGSYDLHIQQNIEEEAGGGSRQEYGALSPGDQTLSTGEYLDVFTFDGIPGQHAVIDVYSAEFDTYLIVTGPGEVWNDNDDAEGNPGHSIVEMDITETGTYRAMVTSYEEGETGEYELLIQINDIPQGSGGAGEVGRSQRDVRQIEMGGSLTGMLEDGDGKLEGGEYRDFIAFDGTAGQSISVEMSSSDFDTYLGLVLPTEEIIDNDDYEGSQSRSRIDLTLRDNGRYHIIATSYNSGETGTYQVTLQSGAAPSAPVSIPSGGGVYGLFVGISDYPGDDIDLSFCAEDAEQFAGAMTRGGGMPSGNGIILTDSDATTSNVRSALREIGGRMSSDDLFILFYSGHGGRIERASGFERSDPDGVDETLHLYDDDITDNELSALLDDIDARITILVLDACFSGGFAKDVISVPGRMGFFSSEEDVTSMVAAKFLAGGYLARFAADAVGEHLADSDRDGEITALELSQYLHERYRADVKSGSKSDYVSLSSRQLGYQHLVVDRGSIGAFEVIFR